MLVTVVRIFVKCGRYFRTVIAEPSKIDPQHNIYYSAAGVVSTLQVLVRRAGRKLSEGSTTDACRDHIRVPTTDAERGPVEDIEGAHSELDIALFAHWELFGD